MGEAQLTGYGKNMQKRCSLIERRAEQGQIVTENSGIAKGYVVGVCCVETRAQEGVCRIIEDKTNVPK